MLPGITDVVADNKTNTVKIAGKGLNIAKIRETVNGLGYKFVD